MICSCGCFVEDPYEQKLPFQSENSPGIPYGYDVNGDFFWGFMGGHHFYISLSVYFPDVFRIEHRNLVCHPALGRLHRRIQLDPVETAVFGVRIDTRNRSFKPTLTFPEIRIKKDFYMVTDTQDFGYHRVIPGDRALLFRYPRHTPGDFYAPTFVEWPGSRRCDTSNDR